LEDNSRKDKNHSRKEVSSPTTFNKRGDARPSNRETNAKGDGALRNEVGKYMGLAKRKKKKS